MYFGAETGTRSPKRGLAQAMLLRVLFALARPLAFVSVTALLAISFTERVDFDPDAPPPPARDLDPHLAPVDFTPASGSPLAFKKTRDISGVRSFVVDV